MMPSDETSQNADTAPVTNTEVLETSSEHWFSRSDQLFLIVVSSAIVLMLIIRTLGLMHSGPETIEIDQLAGQSYTFQVEINSATWVEWMQLDGVGEAMGRRIVADREANGPFASIADVQRVKGIGAATLAKMQPHLRCDDCEAE